MTRPCDRTFYRLRIFTCSKSRPPSIIIIIVIISLLLLCIQRASNHQHIYRAVYSNFNAKSSNRSTNEKILVPVHISRLYDHQVVCTGHHGVLHRHDLLNQLSTICHVSLNENVSIDLQPPDDFQIRSLLTSKYIQLWRQNNTCSLFRNETIAILISYRDREKNLRNLLYNLIPFLERQSILNYKIFIVEQQTSGAFNKGRLYNIAFYHLMKTYKPTCVIFHDADLIPENNHNLYTCLTSTDHPIHMSANVRFQRNGSYSTIYPFLVGGVLTIRPKSFIILNGYSNEYFNWGGEDDDMGLRFLSKDICVQRPTNGYYYAASHPTQTRNNNRFKLLFDAVLRQDSDGLNNIDKLAVIENVSEYPLVTWMTVKWIDGYVSVL